MSKKKKIVEAPPAAPIKAERARPVKQEPLAWIRGLVISERNVETWHPLYCFRWPSDRMTARGTLRRILEMDQLPREITHFEDFDLQLPEGYSPDSFDSPSEAVLSDSEPDPAPTQRRRRKSPPTAPSAGPKKKRKRCREVYDANPRDRCIRKRGHETAHRDLSGHEWTD